MIIKDGQTPDGRVVKPRRQSIELAPLTTRQMTESEREKYGEPDMEKAKERTRMITPGIIAKREAQKREAQKKEEFAHFGERVKAERQRRGMNLWNFSLLCDVSDSTLKNIERGKPCRKETKERICKALGWEQELLEKA